VASARKGNWPSGSLTDERFRLDEAGGEFQTLAAILDDVFGAQRWRTGGDLRPRSHYVRVVRAPVDVINDRSCGRTILSFRSRARANLKLTVSSPIQVRDVRKVPASAPRIGEHNEEILKQLGFDSNQIERSLRAASSRNNCTSAGGLGVRFQGMASWRLRGEKYDRSSINQIKKLHQAASFQAAACSSSS